MHLAMHYAVPALGPEESCHLVQHSRWPRVVPGSHTVHSCVGGLFHLKLCHVNVCQATAMSGCVQGGGGGGSECPGTQELPRVLLVRPPLLAAPQPILSVHQQLVLRVWSILPWLFAGGAPETDPTVILYPMSR